MKKRITLGLLGALSLVAACSGKGDKPYSGGLETGGTGGVYMGGYGGVVNHPGGAGGTTTGGNGGTAPNGDDIAPVVSIDSPIAVADPEQDGVLIENDVTVLCLADQSPNAGSSAVDSSTVQIEMLSATGESLEKKAGVATANAHEFSAEFVLTDVPNGKIGFRCTASDVAKPKLTSTATTATFVDHGPKITVISPVPGSAHALGQISIDFTVGAEPLAAQDDNAGVETVTLSIDGVDIPLEAGDELTPGTFHKDVALTDAALFPTPLTGSTPIQITATNHRTPAPAMRIETYDFTIDGEGPVIKVTSPKDKIVVGGNVILQFSVADVAAGVDAATVEVSINDQKYPFDVTSSNWMRTGDNFTFKFDSANVGSSQVQVTVNIRASDKAGNAAPGSSLLLYLDNKPPTVDLDPANLRERDEQTNQCSMSFDPVGTLAVNDLDGSYGVPEDGNFKHYPIGVGARFRALVYEETNTFEGNSFLHYAGTDATKVRLYIMPNPSLQSPLLIDKSGDGVCDEIGDVDNINFSVLDKVTPAGAVRYGGDDSAVAPLPGSCVLKNANTPTPLCNQTSDMWRVLTHHPGAESIIYSVKVNTGIECAGIDWEFGPYANADGWVCFAVRAVDAVGNVGISRPLRLCMDDPARVGEPACKNSSTIPPTCTDGCTPPPRANVGILNY